MAANTLAAPGEGYDAFIDFLYNSDSQSEAPSIDQKEAATTTTCVEPAPLPLAERPANYNELIKQKSMKKKQDLPPKKKGNEYQELIRQKSAKNKVEKLESGNVKITGNSYTKMIKQQSIKKQMVV